MADDTLVVPAPARVRLSTASGRVTVVGEARDDIVVSKGGRARSEPPDDAPEVVVQTSSGDIEVRCPIGTDVVVGTASGRIELIGQLGAARATTSSGSIRVESVTSADLRSQSARIEVQSCLGACRVMNRSGRVTVDRAGEVHVEGVSGTIQVAADLVRVRTVSGKVRITTGGGAAVETVSGSVEVTVPAGFHPLVRTRGQGRTRVEVPEGDDGEIAVRSVSASVRVRSA